MIPFAFGLLQDQFHILQVMAGNQDGLAFFVAQGDLGRDGMAVGFGIGRVQDFHGPQIDLAGLHGQADPVVQGQVLVQGGRQSLMDKGVNGFVFLAEDAGRDRRRRRFL